MSLIVAKFGGTSVASPERIKNVAKRLVRMRQQGVEVVAVVSAMGKTTDELMGLASAVTAAPPSRELDRLLSTGEQVSMTLLAMAIESMGYKSMSFTGRQAGIETDGTHNKAKIIKVHNERILDALEAGYIPVVAGFQGIDANGDITTLGRGGSDTTAVAIAWGINADVCEIYSDVDGVYTTDPRVAPRARKLDSVCYDDMLELSSAGSGVLQSRAVEFARKWKVVIHSRSAFSEAEGTYIKEEYEMEEAVITGIASDTSEVKVTVRGLPDAPAVAAKMFSALAANNVNLDKWKVVIHSRSAFSEAEGTYIKEEYEMEEAVITGIASDTSEVKVTVRGLPDAPAVAAKMFSALAANNVNLDMIIQNVAEGGVTDISFTTPGADLGRARETLARVVPEIGGREFIVDEDIAKVSLVGTGMKSSPGVASRAFQTLGDNNINIVAISTSPIRLSVIVDAAQAAQAVQCLHTAFGLDSDDLFVETQLSAEEIAAKMKKGR